MSLDYANKTETSSGVSSDSNEEAAGNLDNRPIVRYINE